MKPIFVIAFLALCACGGGGVSALFDPVTHVSIVDTLGGDDARSHWDDRGTAIYIYRFTDTDRAALLEHELWHLLTRDRDHPNPLGCISYVSVYDYGDDPPSFPCSVELEQVHDAGRTLTVSFPDDPAPLLEAAAFWNDALGYQAVTVE